LTVTLAPGAASPERLTEALRRACALGTGRVRDVKVLSSIKKLRSHAFRLHLPYEGAAEESPTSVILTWGMAETAGHLT
jgi:hypothetical protein